MSGCFANRSPSSTFVFPLVGFTPSVHAVTVVLLGASRTPSRSYRRSADAALVWAYRVPVGGEGAIRSRAERPFQPGSGRSTGLDCIRRTQSAVQSATRHAMQYRKLADSTARLHRRQVGDPSAAPAAIPRNGSPRSPSGVSNRCVRFSPGACPRHKLTRTETAASPSRSTTVCHATVVRDARPFSHR